MTLQEFEKLIDSFGSDQACWPSDRRDAALAFLGSSVEAQALVSEAQALDGLLNEAPTGDVHGALVARILETAPGAAAPVTSQTSSAPHAPGLNGWLEGIITAAWPEFGWMRPAGLLVATMAFGFYMGLAGPGSVGGVSATDTDVFAYVFSLPNATDWDDGSWQ